MGKCFLFCDADDYLEQDAISTVYKLINDTADKDLCVGTYISGYNLIRNKERGLLDEEYWLIAFMKKVNMNGIISRGFLIYIDLHYGINVIEKIYAVS